MSESSTFTEEEMPRSKTPANDQAQEQTSTDDQQVFSLDFNFRNKIVQHLTDQSLWLGGPEEDKKRLRKANSDMILDLLNLPVLNQPVNLNVCEACSKMPADLEDALNGFDEEFRSSMNKVVSCLKNEVKASIANEVAKLKSEFSALKANLTTTIERSIGSSPEIIFNFKMNDVMKFVSSLNFYSEWFVVRNVKWRISAKINKQNLIASLVVNESDVTNLSYKAQIVFNLVNRTTGSDHLGKSIYHNFYAAGIKQLCSPNVSIPLSVFDQPSKGFLNDDGSIILQAVVKVDPPTNAPNAS